MGGFADSFRQQWEKVREGAGVVPTLTAKPALARLWLLGARFAQIAIFIILLLLPTGILPGLADSLIDKISPPKGQAKFFGLLTRKSENPALKTRRRAVRIILWGASGGVVIWFLLLSAPAALARARSKSEELETEADSLTGSRPSQSVLLYNEAILFACEPVRELTLKKKIRSLDAHITNAGKTGTSHDATLAVPSQTVRTSAADPGRYRIEGEIGRGAMGLVYRAHDTVLDRPVALKELTTHLIADTELVARFRNEAKVLAKLSHPGAVQVYDLIESNGRLSIAMELVEGGDLDDLLQKNGPMPIAKAARLGAQMADAMAYCHSKGIIHRDFKPANVLLTKEGKAKISDFGIAKFNAGAQLTQEGTILGSPAFMSPEQASGKTADERSDIYSLGVVLYYMFTGRVPFDGETASILAQHITQEPQSPTSIRGEVGEEIDKLLLSMLAKDPEARPSDLGQVSSVLKKYIS